MHHDKLHQFADQKYLNLETYRKNGTPVATPMWFAEHHGVLYVYSRANAGKVKRIRQNPTVRVVPCTARGTPTGDWVGGTARMLDEPDAALGHQRLNAKYGWLKRFGDVVSRLRHRAGRDGHRAGVSLPAVPQPYRLLNRQQWHSSGDRLLLYWPRVLRRTCESARPLCAAFDHIQACIPARQTSPVRETAFLGISHGGGAGCDRGRLGASRDA